MDAGSVLVDRYRLARRIGSGGVGQVWSALDTVLGRDVAIKTQEIDPELDRAAYERFLREARTAAGLQHPNVVTIFDSGTEGDTAFLVMELLPGPTLSGYLGERGPLPEDEAVALAAQVASGLAAAHGAGVVHRDIKPANLMFDARGVLKIVDFGIARLTQTATTQLTVVNGIIGSPPYLSPEGVDGRPVDERSDLYALGAVLMVLLTGRGPFEAEHPLALLQQHLHAAPPRLRDRRPDISPALDTLVAQMLSKAPQDRPQSAVEVLERLHGAPAAVPPPALAMAGEPARRPPRPRSMLGAGFLAGAAAMALVAAVVIALTTRSEAPTAGPLAGSAPAAMPTAAIAGGADPAPTSTPATAPPPRSAASTAPSPTTEPSRRARPTLGASASAARNRPARSAPGTDRPTAGRSTAGRPTADRPTTSQAATARSADVDSGDPAESGWGPALAGLRASVQQAAGQGELEAEAAAGLDRRVDGLAQQLAKKTGAQATKKVDDLDRHLAGLTERGELAPAGAQRIGTALAAVRAQVAG